MKIQNIIFKYILDTFDYFVPVKREIDERKEFLEEMQSLGSNIGRQYEGLIRSEIASKTEELERLRYQQSFSSSNDEGDESEN